MAIDFSPSDFFYPLGIVKLTRILDKNQWAPHDELVEYQIMRLKTILDQAYRNVPYYRNLFLEKGITPEKIVTPEDLRIVPLLNKRIIKNNFHSMTAENARRYSPKRYTTSGTTGEPLTFYLDKQSNILEFCYYWRYWGWAGYRLGDRFAEFGSEYFLRRSHLSEKPFVWQRTLRRLMLNSGQLSAEQAKKMIGAVRRYKPQFLKGLASTLYFFAMLTKESGVSDVGFKAAFSTGEVLSAPYRRMIESVFHCPVMDSYGHMERTAAICQCPQGGYHVNMDYGLLQIENKSELSGQNTSIGKAVGTSLYNMAMPLVRYELGDEIETFNQPVQCSCGRTLPLIKAIHGRKEDVIITPDGRYITSLFIVPEFIEGIKFVQFIQENRMNLRILAVPGKGWNRQKRERLKSYTRKMIGPEMKITLTEIKRQHIVSDNSGKKRIVISRLEQ